MIEAGGDPDIDYATAQERSKFMIEASKILVHLDPQLLLAQGLTGFRADAADPQGPLHPRDLDTAEELYFEDHVETLAFGWHTRINS